MPAQRHACSKTPTDPSDTATDDSYFNASYSGNSQNLSEVFLAAGIDMGSQCESFGARVVHGDPRGEFVLPPVVALSTAVEKDLQLVCLRVGAACNGVSQQTRLAVMCRLESVLWVKNFPMQAPVREITIISAGRVWLAAAPHVGYDALEHPRANIAHPVAVSPPDNCQPDSVSGPSVVPSNANPSFVPACVAAEASADPRRRCGDSRPVRDSACGQFRDGQRIRRRCALFQSRLDFAP